MQKSDQASFKKKWFVILFVLTIITPICITYFLDPISFNYTWPGGEPIAHRARVLYLFFLWLIFLEIILVWKNFIQKDFSSFKGWKTFILISLAAAPSIYAIITNLSPVSEAIVELGKLVGVLQILLEVFWPLSLEYLALTLLFTLFILFAYGKIGLKFFAVSLLFLGAIGTVYMVNTLYPFGAFTPFQFFVPFTASSAAQVLNWMGYKTRLFFATHKVSGAELPVIEVIGTGVKFGIDFPCAGVQSLFIYTFTVLLLLKQMNTHVVSKIVYFVIGAVGTYIVNILRVVSIFLIAIHQGRDAAITFHDFYGEFFAMTWIVLYLMIVVVIHKRGSWRKLQILIREISEKCRSSI